MFVYKDMSFCLQDCVNLKCKRNKKHLDDMPEELKWMPIAFIEKKGCKERMIPERKKK